MYFPCLLRFFLSTEVIECYAEGLIGLCSTWDRQDAFLLTSERQVSRFTLCKAARIMKLKSGSKLILKMDRAEAEAAARAAATEAETQRAKFLTDKKAWRARGQAEVGDPSMAGVQQEAPE